MISTTQDLHTFVSALMGGRLLPAPLLAEMRTPHPMSGFGLGLRVQDVGENGATVLFHNGGAAGHAALMYSTPDGGKILTAVLNHVDDAAMSLAAAFHTAQERFVEEVFGGGRARIGRRGGRADRAGGLSTWDPCAGRPGRGYLLGQPMSSSGRVFPAGRAGRRAGAASAVWAAGVQDARDAHTDGLIVDSKALNAGRAGLRPGAGAGFWRVCLGRIEERLRNA